MGKQAMLLQKKGVTKAQLAAFDGDISTTGKVIALAGIGVGNSATADTPGTVIKKVEIFDEAGDSIGFLAVYDDIS